MKTLLICLPKDRVGGRRDEENKQRRYGQHIIMGYNRRQSQQGRLDLGCVLAMDSGGERSSLPTRIAATESGLIDLWARDLCEGLRKYRVNDHANPEYRRENNSNPACRESYDDDHCQPSETCSPMTLVPKSNRAEEES